MRSDEEDALFLCFPTHATTEIELDDEPEVTHKVLIRQELWWLFTSTIPIALSYLCQNSFSFISVLSVGKLGVNELAAASLSGMIVNFVVIMPCFGLTGALESFCGAAFTASSDKTRVGFHMQRGLVAVTLQLIPAAIMFTFIEPLLILAGQTHEISTLCGQYLRIWLLGSWPMMVFDCLRRFVQAQGIMQASTWVIAMVMPIHAINSYLLVWSSRLGLGFVGAPFTIVITNWLMFLGMLIYTANSTARLAWGGFSWKCLDGIWEFYRLAIPSAAMLACSWSAFELVTFGSSLFGPVTMAAQACIFSAMALTYQIPTAIGSATATRIGNSLGLKQQRRARYSAHVAIFMGYVLGITCSLLLFIYRNSWGYIFSNDEEVAKLCAHLMPFFAAIQSFDGMNGLTAGILRALGKQALGVSLAFPSFWLLGIPLGFYLALGPQGLEVVGLWIGLSLAVIVYSLLQQRYIFLQINWSHEVNICKKRLAISSGTE
ncbi:MATE efflux family protein [Coemansia reversa NRRL 1564]|uniref:MATE efflux family protein n=1 Tax=Coemansia reversa (strain ATCC 12441 / NRRL 1564) TaxID=763665 RepID=A0A2G5BBT8_COERN|nr:MATE efflux family protein [Coemansia reversa NRRL 1564]|eukprot:PIA16475.1 MATE efflux family protein [Coemansia reversa NRRL 1564]